MAEYVQVDEKEYEQLLASQERLDTAIKQCGTYFALDSHMDEVNSCALEILNYIKTGLKKD